MHIARCDMGVGNDVVFAIHGAMVEIIKALRLSLTG